MDKQQILNTLASRKDEIATDFKAEIKGIFGSYAQGKQNKNSDLDVLVEFLPGATLFDCVNLKMFLEEITGLEIDLVSQKAIRDELKKSIYEDLVTL